jgi:hypothetical protein
MQDSNPPQPDLGQPQAPPAISDPAAPATPALEIHPLATLFPEMGEREFEAFVANLKAQGQLEPVWTYQGKVIDGRHRLRACTRLGIAPKTREWDGSGAPSLLEFVIALNLHRRHLKERQRAMLAARLKPAFEADAHDRKGWAGRTEDLGVNSPPGRSNDLVGKLLNVSGKSVKCASKVLQKGIPAVIAAVDACKLAVSTAADMCECPADEQARLMTLKPNALLAALAPVRAARAARRKRALSPAEKLDQSLIQGFQVRFATLRKEGKMLVLEFSSDNFLDELCAAVRNEHHFKQLVQRGVFLTTKKKGAA